MKTLHEIETPNVVMDFLHTRYQNLTWRIHNGNYEYRADFMRPDLWDHLARTTNQRLIDGANRWHHDGRPQRDTWQYWT